MFRIVSYYTLDTPYVAIAHDYLMKSIKNLDIKSDIHGVSSLGSWGLNTSFKPTFILNMLEKHAENVVFIDCDATLNEIPTLFENIPEEYDFGAYILDRNLHYNKSFSEENRYELLTGTLWLRNTPETKEIVNKWVQECAKSKAWEQKILQKILKEHGKKVYNLPLSYCYINSLPNGEKPLVKCDKPIVTHYQCSRQTKRQMLGLWVN